VRVILAGAGEFWGFSSELESVAGTQGHVDPRGVPRQLLTALTRVKVEHREAYHEAERAGVAVAIGGRALIEPVLSTMP
jgi:hypothetical protein